MKVKSPLSKVLDTPHRLVWLAVALCACLTAHRAQARSYFVNDGSRSNDLYCAAAGADANSGLSPETPKASLDSLLSHYTLTSNDTVYVDTGTYYPASNIVVEARHSGISWECRPTIQGAGERRTVFNRQSSAEYACCLEVQADYICLQGLAFTGAKVGLFVDASYSMHAEIIGNTFYGNTGSALLVQASTYYYSYGIFTIANNLVFGNPNGLRLEPDCTDMLGDSFLVNNNTIAASSGTALLIGGYVWGSDVRNNIITAQGGAVCLESPVKNGLFYSNYNCLWTQDGGVIGRVNISGTSVTLASMADWQCFTKNKFNQARDEHSFSRDPAFAGVANMDYHLKSFGGRWQPSPGSTTNGAWVADQDKHSPCVDAAYPYYYTNNLAFEPQPNGGIMNLGAYGGTPQASKAAPGRMLVAMAPDLGQDVPQPQPVYWNASGQGWSTNDIVYVEYSLNGGAVWQQISNSETVAVNGLFSWQRPADAFSTNGCWIQVVMGGNTSCVDKVFLPYRPEPPTTFYVNDASTANDRFCTAAGSDTHDGLSPDKPVASLQTILSRYMLGPSNTVYIDTGTYYPASNIVIAAIHGGDWNYPLTIQGAGRGTVFNRQSLASGTCCLENHADHIWIKDLTFTGADVGLVVDSSLCSYANILGNTFFNNKSTALVIQPSSYSRYGGWFTIAHNQLYNNGNGMSLEPESLESGCSYKVLNNTILVTNGTAITLGGRIWDSEVYNNIVVATGSGVCLGSASFYGVFQSDYNNLWAHSGGAVGILRANGVTNKLTTLADWQCFIATNYFTTRDVNSFSHDPAFADAANADFHLKSFGGRWQPAAFASTNGTWVFDSDKHSLCVDAASPNSETGELALEPDPNGGRKNLGAYGGTPQASKAAPGRVLLVMAPDQGQSPEQPQPIYWNATGLGWEMNATVHLDYSLDGGNSWQAILNGQWLSIWNGCLFWTRPEATFNSFNGCWIRVVSDAEPSCSDKAFLPNRSGALPAQFFVNDSSLAGDIWCTTAGSDANDGFSDATPMASIQAVIDRYKPGLGTTIYVDAGTYLLSSDLILPNTGAGGGPSNDWFRLIGAGSKTILNRQTTASGTCCIRVYQDFAHIEGFQFRGAATGMMVYPSSCRNATIINNTFAAYNGTGITILPDANNAGTDTYTIRNNLLYGSGGGLNLQSGTGNHLGQFTVENNTLSVNGSIGIACGGRPANTYLYNNIVVAKGSGYCVTIDSAGALAQSDYNDFYAYGGASVARWTIGTATRTASTLADWQSGVGQDAYSLSRDPLFVSSANGDYHLRSQNGSWHDGQWTDDTSTSPCIDAGKPSSNFSLEPTPNGGRINLGAYGGTSQASRSVPIRTLALLNPHGGETWSGSVSIVWSASGNAWLSNDTVRIEYSSNGTGWTTLSGATAKPPTGSYTWALPTTANASFFVRVVCNQDSSVYAATATASTVLRLAATYYVNDASTNGDWFCTAGGTSTNNTGTSPNSPLPSLADVLSRYHLGPGDTVYVDTGYYPLISNIIVGSQHGGSADNPIRIVSSHNGAVLYRQSVGTNNRYCLELQADYVRVEGLTCSSGQIGIMVNASTARHAQLVGNICKDNTTNGIVVKPQGTLAGEEYQILQNVVSGSGAGIYLQGSQNMYDSRTVFVVENNTLLNGGNGITILNANATGRRTNLLKNNLIHTTNTLSSCLVALKSSLHYSDYNNLFNTSGGYIGSLQLSTMGNMSYYTSLAAWRTATGQDANSLSQNSLFVNSLLSSSNLRLRPNSPCIDKGINSFWMFATLDPDGHARISGRSCDIGAYEQNVTSSVRLLLEGAFLPASGLMSSALSQNGVLPLKSPYADDPRTVSRIPSNTTDWVLVQFRQTTNGPAVLSRSVLLRNDGWLVNDKGESSLDVDLPQNESYYLTVKHRNHLAAMSSVALVNTNQSLTYDFTASSSAYLGGSNACALVSIPGAVFYALRAGDCDGDGQVLPVDYTLYESQTNSTGYRRGDVDLDGQVLASDGSRILANTNAVSFIVRPDTPLSPALLILPSRQTLASAESVSLWGGTDASTAPAGQGVLSFSSGMPYALSTGSTANPFESSASIAWAFVQQGNGSELYASGDDQAFYTAGADGSTDIVEAWDKNDAVGRATFNVIGAETIAGAGKALIIAGRKSADDTLWPATDYLADNAYTTLRYRGFSKENLLYLSPEPEQDVDGNGELDDIDGASTLSEATFAFTAAVTNADNLFVYLVDHGGNSSGNGYFRLNASDTITAAQLDAWLDTLQDTYNTKVTVLLDFCYAGSFLDEMSYEGTAPRIVIAACGTNQPSYFVAGGLVSFSSAFFSGIMLGYDVMQCYTLAQNAMSTYQGALLADAKTVAEGTYIGPTSVASGDVPTIGEVCGNQVLSSETSATLWIGSVSSLYPISQAWCQIVPPGYNPDPENPVTSLPSLELAYDESSGRYSVTYDEFTTPGTYNIQFYVQDSEGNVSSPRQSYVAQVGYDDRVILVSGGNTNSAAWPAVEYLSQLAYATLRLRLFATDHIRYLSPAAYQDLDGDGNNDVSAQSSLSSLQTSIAQWAATNATDRLTVYLIGDGADSAFRLNTSECLTTNALASWINSFQATNPVPVNVILDFSGAGAFVPALENTASATNFPDATRIVLASSAAGGEALFSNGGTVSFSQYFLSGLIAGETLGDSYTAARRAIRRVSGSVRQRAQIDDTMNGIANEKDVDGILAASTYLGSAFVTGADNPEIGSVIGVSALAAAGTPVKLWVADVAGMNPISNVWCTVTPPGYSGSGNLPMVELAWNGTNRYEAVCSDFVLPGSYTLTFYAQDTVGAISDPVQSEVILADAFEPDNTIAQASFYDGQPQIHNFHTSSDSDWVRFYLVTNFVYDFETYHHSAALDTVLDIYRLQPETGTLELLDHVDEEGSAMGEYTGMDHPESGWYWANITSDASGTNVLGTYEFSVEIPAAAGTTSLIVLGLNDVTAGALPSNSTASVTGQSPKTFSGSTSVVFSGLTNGTYFVSVPTPSNYFPREDPNVPNQIQSLTNVYYANPRRVTVSGGWLLAGFEMLSSVSVTSGIVRDAWTHEYLGSAQVAFTATSGSLTGVVANGSVILTSYCTNWLSSADGRLPTDIVLGACNWNLSVARTGYRTNVWVGAVSNVTLGAKLSLGTTYLVPLDSNSNHIADSWEARYFPGGGMIATQDSDGDGLDNQSEYISGTDPTNALSVLRFIDASSEAGVANLSWSVTGGRSYQIMSVTSLVNLATIRTNGPWEAAHGQATMQWSDADSPLHKARFYRVLLNNP